ncbi:MAG: hypothetical protein C5B55_15055 [Blastocatellia bacterium]|nr:MAG: hypothetical protein C5B55_15055 [Blastocatellia bacterium]
MRRKTPKAIKIMLLRHAEKPAKDNVPYGVTLSGERSSESLQVRGWQRAGALANLLTSLNGSFPYKHLARPHFIFASKPLRRKGSRRPIETIIPLAEKLGITINSSYPRYDFDGMVEEAFFCKGVVLICWQREYIPKIAEHILDHRNLAPLKWPEERFDVIWVFDLDRSSGRYKFKQVPQRLMLGDSLTTI